MMMTKKRVVYLEFLRMISIFAVIIIHVSAIYLRNYEIGTCTWNIANVYNSITRFCIPLFFMISGAVFLEIKGSISIKEMLNKYVKHMLFVLVIWGIFYYFFDLWVNGHTSSIKSFLLLFFNLLSGNTGYHLWFIYELIVIYCIIPVLQNIVKILERREIEYLIFLFFVFESSIGLLNELCQTIPLLDSLVNINFSLPLFSKYIFCLIIGYYLSHFDVSKKITRLIYFLSIIFIFVMPIGNYLLSVFLNSTINVISMDTGIFSMTIAVGLFLLCKQKENSLMEIKGSKYIIAIGRNVFGIYLIHVFVNSIIFKVLNVSDILALNVIFEILFLSLFVFFVSLFLIILMKKSKVLSNLVR